MKKAIIWSKSNCPYCDQAKSLLMQYGIAIEDRKIGNGWTKEALLESLPNARSVPQIIIDDIYLGGFKELKEYLTVSI